MGPEERIARADQYVERFAGVPGVTGVGIVSSLPFHPSRIDAQDAFTIVGRPWPAGAQAPHVYTTAASPSYFEVMEIPLREGRSLADRDVMGAPKVVVVNETFAERFFPGESPVGHRIETGVMSRPYTWEIVGVVSDVLPTALDSRPDPEVFVPVAQIGVGSLTFVAATSVDPASVLPGLRRAVAEVNPARSVHHAATMEELVSETLAAERWNLALFGTFASVALILTVVGIYGLIRFSVTQRTHEIGVRVAVGAGRGQISSLVVGEALRLTVTGIVLGVCAALVLTRYIDTLLVGVAAHDAWTFAAIVVLMTAVSTVAALLPARHAARVDPMQVLRHE
jgi:putative ABC transport system permease protein